MRGYTHVLIGTGLSLILLRPYDVLSVLVSSYLGSVVPDLDFRYEHRAFLHNVFACLILTLIVYFVKMNAAAFCISYLSHLLLDMLTVKGVALFWPLNDKRIRIAKLKSDDIVANALFCALGAFMILTYFWTSGVALWP